MFCYKVMNGTLFREVSPGAPVVSWFQLNWFGETWTVLLSANKVVKWEQTIYPLMDCGLQSAAVFVISDSGSEAWPNEAVFAVWWREGCEVVHYDPLWVEGVDCSWTGWL